MHPAYNHLFIIHNTDSSCACLRLFVFIHFIYFYFLTYYLRIKMALFHSSALFYFIRIQSFHFSSDSLLLLTNNREMYNVDMKRNRAQPICENLMKSGYPERIDIFVMQTHRKYYNINKDENVTKYVYTSFSFLCLLLFPIFYFHFLLMIISRKITKYYFILSNILI